MQNGCGLVIGNLGNPGFCEKVTSGVHRLLFVPKDDVESLNAVIATAPEGMEDYVVIGSTAMVQKLVTLQSGCEFAEMYASKDLGELKYAVQGSVVGNRSLHATLEVYHPVFRKKVLAFLGLAANLEFLLLVQLENGTWHLLGDLERGATVADGAEAASGKANTDSNGATLQFEWDCRFPQVIFEGWSPSNATYGVEMFRIAYLLADEDGYVLTDENNVPMEIPVL